MQGRSGHRLTDSVISSSCDQYSWNHLRPSPLACDTSSIDDEAAVLMIYGTPNSAANPRDAELAVFVEDGLHTNGRDEERRVVSLAENGRADVAVGGLAEHARDELVRTGCVNSLPYTVHL